jgi:hypothetical protein
MVIKVDSGVRHMRCQLASKSSRWGLSSLASAPRGFDLLSVLLFMVDGPDRYLNLDGPNQE